MKQSNFFDADLLDLDTPEAQEDVLYRAGMPDSAQEVGGAVALCVPCVPHARKGPGEFRRVEGLPVITRRLWVQDYGDDILRLSFGGSAEPPGDQSPMFELASNLCRQSLSVEMSEDEWRIVDSRGRTRAMFKRRPSANRPWGSGEWFKEVFWSLDAVFLPDASTRIPLLPFDTFFPHVLDSVSLGFVRRDGQDRACTFALHATHDEHYCGTGERFAHMDLAGQTLQLENADALGVNSRRTYKNVPFFMSSRGYGVFIHTHAHARLSLAHHSTRATQASVEEPDLDLFLIGGRTPERIAYGYRSLTGFPRNVPSWSYGVWMSRMSYWSAEETTTVARRMRELDLPCDVIHQDTGWFEKDWQCDWQFGATRYPNPVRYLADLAAQGYRMSCWQWPRVSTKTSLWAEALARGYIAVAPQLREQLQSQLGDTGGEAHIDFTNPEAVSWYQGLIERVLRQGVAAIKADFGELIDETASYQGMTGRQLHNLYALLYQRAAWEASARVYDQPILWSRAGWAGCHRYPVHWGGDAACTWDALAATLRGGLHAGLSGFAFWSHDIAGFHGSPFFLSSWPSDELYVRWTQFGVFSSHMRFHGGQPREPYEYPAVLDIVRRWTKLRYALIPYLVQQGTLATKSGYPVLRALVFNHPEDPLSWRIDDQYCFGDAFLVAPVLTEEGTRDVYLPPGSWIDFWTGTQLDGPQLLHDVHSTLDIMPIYVRAGTRVPVYAKAVRSTNDLRLEEAVELTFDSEYRGVGNSVLGPLLQLG